MHGEHDVLHSNIVENIKVDTLPKYCLQIASLRIEKHRIVKKSEYHPPLLTANQMPIDIQSDADWHPVLCHLMPIKWELTANWRPFDILSM